MALVRLVQGKQVAIDTGSLLTIASFNSYTGSSSSQFAGTSSFASTASFAPNYQLTSGTGSMLAPYVLTASTSSMTVLSASYALSASYLIGGINIDTGSFVTTSSFNAFTSSYNTGSFTGSFTGSLFGTSSWAVSASNAQTASYVLNAVSSSFTSTASYATIAGNGGVTQLLAGANITLGPTNGLGQVTISSTGGGGSSFNTATGSYGSFYSTVTQTNVASTARSMSLNITDISNGVSISGSTNPYNTYIKTENAGVYNIQFSAQVDKTDSGTDEIWIWIRKNGTNLTDTATSIQLVGNGAHYVTAWNFFVNAAANDYYQLMWYSPDANVRLHAEPAFGVVPGIPSLIVTANRVDQFLSNTGSFSGSFTGAFSGSGANLNSIPTTAIVGNFTQIATGSVTASVTPTQFSVVSGSMTEFVVTGNGVTLGGAITDIHRVTGSLLVTGSNTIIGNQTITGSLRVSSSNATQFLVGNQSLFVNSSGNVGIGTITPNDSLEISSSLTASLKITGTGGSLITIARQGFPSQTGVIRYPGNYQIGTVGSDALQFLTNNVIRMQITDSTGNVGIGTTSPTVRLDVSGSARITNGLSVTSSLAVNGTSTLSNGQTTIQGSSATTGNALVVSNSTPSTILTVQNNGQVLITGSLSISGSFNLPLSQSTTPQTGSAYWSGSFLFIYNGVRYMSASFF